MKKTRTRRLAYRLRRIQRQATGSARRLANKTARNETQAMYERDEDFGRDGWKLEAFI